MTPRASRYVRATPLRWAAMSLMPSAACLAGGIAMSIDRLGRVQPAYWAWFASVYVLPIVLPVYAWGWTTRAVVERRTPSLLEMDFMNNTALGGLATGAAVAGLEYGLSTWTGMASPLFRMDRPGESLMAWAALFTLLGILCARRFSGTYNRLNSY